MLRCVQRLFDVKKYPTVVLDEFYWCDRCEAAAQWSISQDLTVLLSYPREARLYAVWCGKLVLPLVHNELARTWLIRGLRGAERFARGRGAMTELLNAREYAHKAAFDYTLALCDESAESHPSHEDRLGWAPAWAIAWACHPNVIEATGGAVHFASKVALLDVQGTIAAELRRVIAALEAGRNPYPWPLMLLH